MREGWLSVHPTTGEPVEVVNALWLTEAKNESSAYALALQMAQDDLKKTVEALSRIARDEGYSAAVIAVEALDSLEQLW